MTAASLEPLAQLRHLTGNGALSITGCDAIVDLAPLAQLSGIQRLQLSSEAISSLDGLQIGEGLVSLQLSGPQLTDIDALSRLRGVERKLTISETALRDLAPLAQLRGVGSLLLTDNPVLETLHGLEALVQVDTDLTLTNNNALRDTGALAELRFVEQFVVQGNDSLPRLVDFKQLRVQSVRVTSNQSLEEIPQLINNLYDSVSFGVPPEVSLSERGQLEIAHNPALLRFAVPREWQAGVYVIIENNRSLRELNLSELQSLDLLAVRRNEALDTLHLGALASVDALEVVDNPLLSPAAFDTLQTFERTMSGNAAGAP